MVTQRLAQGVSGLIGLGQEAYAHNKQKKDLAHQKEGALPVEAGPGTVNRPASQNPAEVDSDDIDSDEDTWINDDAQRHLTGAEAKHENNEKAVTVSVQNILQLNPPPTVQQFGRLPAPVMIPQRRPNASLRGFVRAYAPDLASSNVSEKAFFDFLQGLEQSVQGQGTFNVANGAVALSVLAYTVSYGPSVAVHFSALIVHASIEAGRRMYVNSKRNSFLDDMNEQFFKPRGLYAMLMKYDGDHVDKEVVDFDTAAWTAVEHRDDPHRSKAKNAFTSAAGKTLAAQMPYVCPLEFPTLQHASDEQKKSGFRRAMAFATDYYDRRGQALFAEHNPHSQLKVEQKEFAGQYADPTRFENSGIIGVLSGGRFDRGQRKWERRNQKRIANGQQPLQPGQSGGRISSALRPVRKALSTGVLYLLIVNMPTDEELAHAEAVQAKIKQENPKWYEQFRM